MSLESKISKASRAFAGVSVAALALGLAVPVAAQTTDGDNQQEVVVTGLRAAERAALQNKRASDQVMEALVASDVGKLPDQNVAEAVRRLPGLSVANDQGEGRYVIIRGVNPNLVNVTVNGQTQPAPEPDGRQVKLDDIPSSLISAVNISKSITADQDANAIGGAVDIKTLSAFDRSGNFFFNARGQYGYYNINKAHPYEGDAQVGGRFGADKEFGAVVSGSYSRRPIESENFQASETYLANGGPDQYGLRDYNLVRTRAGVVVNLDWRASPDVKLYLRGTYSRFQDHEIRDQNRVDSIVYTGTESGTYVGRPSILIRKRDEDDNTKSLLGGANVRLGAGTLDLTGSYARAVKNDPLRSEFNFRGSATGASSASGSFDLSESPYDFTINPPLNPALLPLNTVNYDHRHAQEDLWQLRADYSMPIGIGDNSTIKIGAKYLNRHKTNDRQYEQYSRNTTFNADVATYIGDTTFYGDQYYFGPRIDYAKAQAYIDANPGVLKQSASNLASSLANSLVNDYDVREKISAAYAMATLKFGQLTLIPGVRIEHTEDNAAGKLITTGSTASEDFNSFGKRSYTNIFPGINAKYTVTDKFVLRGAVTTSIGRPNYPDLTPFVSVDTTTSPPTVTLGNPGIKPYKAWNLDATAEYYLQDDGVLSVGLFYKNITNPIYTQTISVANGTFANQNFPVANVIQPFNADKAIIKGIEFNFQYQFSFLPGALNGLGVSANFTMVGGHGSGLANRVGNFPLFFQSKRIGSVQLTYEKYGISARLAYSYRSHYLDLIGNSAATDEYTDDNGQLDARIGYDITKSVNVYVEGVNLNDAPWRRYIGKSSQLVEREHYDYSVRGGIQLKF